MRGIGDLVHGAYDDLGIRYIVPNYCLSDPTNLLPDSESKLPSTSSGAETETETESDSNGLQISKKKKKKGKQPLNMGGRKKVRVRLSEGGDCVVRFEEGERVGGLLEKVRVVAGLGGRRVRLVYLGKM